MIDTKRLARVLRTANAYPYGLGDKRSFYTLKQGICETFGRKIGKDVQKITHDCWGPHWGQCGPDCDKCGGTGIFEIVYVELERWQVGDCVFHRPVGRCSRPHQGANIDGIIKHRKKAGWRACAIALARLFSYDLYWRGLQEAPSVGFGKLVKRVDEIAAMCAPGNGMLSVPAWGCGLSRLQQTEAPF